MTLNSYIKSILEVLSRPVEFLKYTGDEKEFLTYTSGKKPGLFADDDNQTEIYTVSISVYSDKNYLSLIEKIIAVMKAAGFTWVDSGEDMFDEEVNLFYKVIYFQIERSEI